MRTAGSVRPAPPTLPVVGRARSLKRALYRSLLSGALFGVVFGVLAVHDVLAALALGAAFAALVFVTEPAEQALDRSKRSTALRAKMILAWSFPGLFGVFAVLYAFRGNWGFVGFNTAVCLGATALGLLAIRRRRRA